MAKTWTRLGAALWILLAGGCLALANRPEPGPALLLLALGALGAEFLSSRARPRDAVSVAGAFYQASCLDPSTGPAATVVLVLAGVGARTLLEEGRLGSERLRLALLDGLPPVAAGAAVLLLSNTPLAAAGGFVVYLLAALGLPRLLRVGQGRSLAAVVAIACAGGALGRLLHGEPWWALWMFPVLALLQRLLGTETPVEQAPDAGVSPSGAKPSA